MAGNKPASHFPLLTEIPDGKVVHSISTDNVGGPPGVSSKNKKCNPGQGLLGPQRTSSSSLASLGEDILAGELQAVQWQAGNALSASTTGPASSASPSPSLVSRPVSAQSERELNYAQLDLAPATQRRDSDESSDPPKSPRHPHGAPRPLSGLSEVSTASSACTSYAQIDFKKSEGPLIKAVPSAAALP